MEAVLRQLRSAAFLSDVGPDDRRIWRLVATVLCGLGAAMFAFVAIGIIAGIGYVVYLGSGGAGAVDPQVLMERLEALQDPAHQFSFGEVIAVLLVVGIGNCLLFIGFVLVACLIQKRPFMSYVTAAARFRWRMLLLGMLLFVVVLGPVLAVGAWLDPNMPTYPLFRLTEATTARFVFVLVAVLCLIPAAFAEEVLFRGWLLKHTAAFTRSPVVLLLINGVLFSLMHWPDIGPSAFLARLIMGAGFCYMVLRLGGIEFATGAHAANNILLLLFVQPLTIAPQPGQPFMPMMAIGALVEVTGYILVTEMALRWRAAREWAGAYVEERPQEA